MSYNGYKVIDSHCHIYPEKIVDKAVPATDRFYDVKSACRGTVSDLIENGCGAGVDMFIVQSVATTPKQVNSINEFIAYEVSQNKEKLIGLGTLHPDSENLTEDVKHLMELGLKGVKLHPDIQAFKIDDYRCLKIYELCEANGLPILMHTGDNRYDYSNPNRLIPVLDIYKDLTVIGAHMGGWSIWEEASKQLADKPNLYVDCSSSFYYLSLDTAKEIIKRYGTDKVLFGTDYPMWSPKAELDTFFSLELSDEDNRRVLSENAIRVFNI